MQVWSLIGPTSVHQDVETGCSSPSLTGSSSGVLPGRYSAPTPEQERTLEVISPGAGFTPEPGLYSETGEVLGRSDAATDLLGRPAQLDDDDLIITSRKTIGNYYHCKGNSATARNVSPNIIHSFGADEPCFPNWTLDSPTVLSKSAARPHQSIALIQHPSRLMKTAPSPSSLEELRW